MNTEQQPETRWAIRGRQVVLPDRIAPASIHIEGGTIVRVSDWDDIDADLRSFDVGQQVIFPGVVDLHAHINEPGRSDWEGFESATRAAAAGGVTTLVDMPLNTIPPTVNAAAFDEKIAAARGKLWIDVGLHGGIVPGNGRDLPQLISKGIVGLKCFLCDSGVEEFPAVTIRELADAIDRVARLDPWILVHAESPEVLKRNQLQNGGGICSYHDYLQSRPDEAECLAIGELIQLARRSNARIHIVHLSSARALPPIAQAKEDRLAITTETCPHYLTFDAESIADGAVELKCAPPIRSANNREKLWEGLRRGAIDIIASDHSPCLPEMKANKDFAQAWGGITSLQCSLAAVWTEALPRGFSLIDLALWMCRRPAELAHLPEKGCIAPGKDADLICFAPEETFTFDIGDVLYRHKITPYAGRRMCGVVKQTFLRGRLVYNQGSWASRPHGKILRSAPRFLEQDSTAGR
ncbi:MAG TPA: allantoinase AllB [Candidatus Binatia bacterium]|nr:allantoinase AllB [Candidatus Binatia bacterium]